MTLRRIPPRQPLTTPSAHLSLKWWAILLLFGGLSFTAGLFFYFWQPSSELSCYTNQNTLCSPEQEAELSSLQNRPWLRVQKHYQTMETSLTQKNQDVVTVHFRKTLPRNLEVEIVKAEALFIATTGSQHWQVYDNGFFKLVEAPSLPVFRFADQSTLRSLSPEESEQLAYLFSKVQNLTPRWKEVAYLSRNQIEAEIENRGKVLLKLGDHQIIDHQLATLQSFLRSSTMDQDYKALDLRFEGLAVVKE